MMERKLILIAIIIVGLMSAGIASAHTPLCSCYDNGDATITCEGGFSDGSSAAGVEMRVEDGNGKVLIKGKMDQDSEFTFKKPSGDYTVVFDAGEGHIIRTDGKDIFE